MDFDVAFAFLVDAPGEVDGAEHAGDGVDEDLHRVFDRNRLKATAFQRMYFRQRAEEVAGEVE